MSNPTQWLVINGNPVDGHVFYGPFDTHEEASTYGDDQISGDWWVAPLEAPDED